MTSNVILETIFGIFSTGCLGYSIYIQLSTARHKSALAKRIENAGANSVYFKVYGKRFLLIWVLFTSSFLDSINLPAIPKYTWARRRI